MIFRSLFSAFKRPPKPVLGLDIGSHSIKLVELVHNGSGRSVRCFGRAILPPKAIVDGSIKEPDQVARVVKALLQNIRPKTRRTATSIAGYSVIVKKVVVPYIQEREIEDNLVIEAENYVPFEIEEVYIDFFMLKSQEEQDEKTGTPIFLVAAKKEVVDEYADLIQEVGLVPAVVDVDAFALGNALEGVYGQLPEAVAIVDIGAQKTNLNIVYQGASCFARDMALGGIQLTDAISEATGLEYQEAERVKISGTDDEALKKEVAKVCSEICHLWAEELKKALDFFRSNSNSQEHPTYLFLSGGCALLKGLDAVFEHELSMPVRIFDPWKDYETDKNIDEKYQALAAPQMTIATGLALRTI